MAEFIYHTGGGRYLGGNMIDLSRGRYWDEGIQLIDGCTPCSPGCDHCWSAAMTSRFECNQYLFPTVMTENKKFIGNIILHPDRLKRFNTRKPKAFAIWNDLLHEKVDRHFIEDSLTMMWKMSKNIYLILTKRPERLSEISRLGHWPYDNVYLGLTVCNQQEADEKIPIFLQVPGKKFLSIEPMLGMIDLSHYLWFDGANEEWFDSYSGGYKGKPEPCYDPQAPFDAVILGGETGPGARPMHPDWVRSVRDQCQSAGVPFFFKQWGEWSKGAYIPDQYLRGTRGGDDPRYDQESNMMRVGRNKAGRLLDGRTHDDLPWAKIG